MRLLSENALLPAPRTVRVNKNNFLMFVHKERFRQTREKRKISPPKLVERTDELLGVEDDGFDQHARQIESGFCVARRFLVRQQGEAPGPVVGAIDGEMFPGFVVTWCVQGPERPRHQQSVYPIHCRPCD